MRRWLLRVAALLTLFAAAFLGWTYWQALQDPIVHRASIAVPDWPAGEPPRTVLLISDTHVAGPDMPPERLARIMDQLNALKPDLVLLAGDYVSDKMLATRYYSAAQAVAPFARLKAPLGVVAVLGNHDYWTDPTGFRRAFAQHGISLLANQAIVRGPFVIGGVDDAFTHRDNVSATLADVAAQGPGVRLILTHDSRISGQLTSPATALLAGHSHCGQMILPEIGIGYGPLAPASWHPCGEKKINGTPRFVAAGLGTSILPLRLGAPADVWLIRFGPGAKAIETGSTALELR